MVKKSLRSHGTAEDGEMLQEQGTNTQKRPNFIDVLAQKTSTTNQAELTEKMKALIEDQDDYIKELETQIIKVHGHMEEMEG